MDFNPFCYKLFLQRFRIRGTYYRITVTSYNGQTITYDAIGNPLSYRDGKCWITTVHLYTDNNNEINYLSELGIELKKLGSTDDLFSINDLGKPATEEEIRVIKEKVLRYVEEQTGIEPNN